MERHGVELDIAAYLDAGKDALSSEAQLHLEGCHTCRSFLEAHGRMAALLRAVPPVAAPSALTLESVLARLPDTSEHDDLQQVLGHLRTRPAPADLIRPEWRSLDRSPVRAPAARPSIESPAPSAVRSSTQPSTPLVLRRRRAVLAAAGLVVAAGLAVRLLPGLAGRRPSDAPVIHVTIVNRSPLDPGLSPLSKERLLAQLPSLGVARSAQ